MTPHIYISWQSVFKLILVPTGGMEKEISISTSGTPQVAYFLLIIINTWNRSRKVNKMENPAASDGQNLTGQPTKANSEISG